MTCDEFVKACVDGGYIYRSEVKRLKEWLEQNPKESYTEEHFIEVYRHFEAIRYEDNISGKWHHGYDGRLNGYKTTKHYKNISGR